MFNCNFLITLLFGVTMFSIKANSQTYETCGTPVSTGPGEELILRQESTESQQKGAFKPAQNAPGQYFKVLFVFAQFSGDSRVFGNWPLGQLPVYANNLVDQQISTTYRDLTLSKFWDEMSMGNYDLIGDVYPSVVTINSEDYYRTNGKNFGHSNRDVLNQINPNVNFAQYDNWSFTGGQWVFQPDGYVDMVFIIYRNPVNTNFWFDGSNGDFTGIAVLADDNINLTLDGKIIHTNDPLFTPYGSGITIKKGADYGSSLHISSILNHELGHYLFGYFHTNGNYNDSHGIMSGNPDLRCFQLTSIEREVLGYIAYTNVYQDNFSQTIGDYFTTGQVIRVPSNISDPSSSSFYLIENHQRLSDFDQIMRGGSLQGELNTTTTLGSGIYIYYVENGASYGSSSKVTMRTADGAFDWSLDGEINMPTGWPAIMPLFKRLSVNKTSSKTDRYPRDYNWYNPNRNRYEWWGPWHDINRLTKQWELTRDQIGDEYDAFTFTGKSIMSPWSNPATLVSATNSFAFQVFNQNGTNITMKVFTTAGSASNLPPSEPQLFKIQNDPTTWSPLLTWSSNNEPDLAGYKVYRGISSNGNEPNYYLRATIANPSAISFIDDEVTGSLSGSKKVFYKISAYDTQNLESKKSDFDWLPYNPEIQKRVATDEEINSGFYVAGSYPNPFNPSTKIVFSLPAEGLVTIEVYDNLGRKIKDIFNGQGLAGTNIVEFNGSNLSSGIYYYKIKYGFITRTGKLILSK